MIPDGHGHWFPGAAGCGGSVEPICQIGTLRRAEGRVVRQAGAVPPFSVRSLRHHEQSDAFVGRFRDVSEALEDPAGKKSYDSGGVPRDPVAVVDIGAAERRTPFDPVEERIAGTPWDVFDADHR